MGEITVEQIVSADGYVSDRDGGIDFFEDVDFGDQSRTDTEQMRWLEDVDAILFGRRTYEMFAGYWPHTDPRVDAVAAPIARIPKFVLSNTLQHAAWGDGEIDTLRGTTRDAARTVMARYRSIAVWGSVSLTDALFDDGLVSTLRLRVVPVLLGSGRALAPASMHRRRRRLRLQASAAHEAGVLTQEYEVLARAE